MTLFNQFISFLSPQIPEEFRQEFESSLLHRNLGRIRFMGWALLVALAAYSVIDYRAFSSLGTPESWSFFMGLTIIRLAGAICVAGFLMVLGRPFPMERLQPIHVNLDLLFAYVFHVFIVLVTAYAYEYRASISGFLAIILSTSCFLRFHPVSSFRLLVATFVMLVLALSLMNNAFHDYSYDLATSFVMIALSFFLARLVYMNRIRAMMKTKLIEKQNAELAKARKVAEEARKDAEEATKAKSDFLAMMSHEIRTPMNTILGMTEVVLEYELPDEVREYLQRSMNSSHQLLSTINDVLDYSKIESGKMSLNEEQFNLGDVLISLAKQVEVGATAKGIKFQTEFDNALPEAVYGDSLRIRQVLLNLLSNAIKFTDIGTVTFKVECEGQGANGKAVCRFVVVDTGIGIETEQQQAIFNSFEQADSSVTRRYGGTGLGLAISKRLSDLMEGELTIESKPGSGAAFTFAVPLKVEA